MGEMDPAAVTGDGFYDAWGASLFSSVCVMNQTAGLNTSQRTNISQRFM